MEKLESKKGTIILETSIVLPIFMLVIFFVYGFFTITLAQNQVTHALLQSSKSLSLDSYLTEHVDSAAEEATIMWSGLSDMILDFGRLSNDKHFSSMNDWYKTKIVDEEADEEKQKKQAEEIALLESNRNFLAKNRFVGYFSGGDEEKADEKLKALGVVGGLNGITFSMTIEGEDMTITIKYDLQFWIDAFDVGKIPMEQSITTKLWK